MVSEKTGDGCHPEDTDDSKEHDHHWPNRDDNDDDNDEPGYYRNGDRPATDSGGPRKSSKD